MPKKKVATKKKAPKKPTLVKKAKKTISKKKTVSKKNIQKKTTLKKKITAKASEAKSQKNLEVKSSRSYKTPSLLRGFKDIMPKDEYYWKTMYHSAEGIAEAYGFGRIETPILEEASLFVRSLGRGTDVIDKEIYIFEDRDGSKICLRPEATASVARAYIGHGMQSLPQPVKLWYWGPMFRHDRPQAGRFRQFHQFSCETLGVHDPVVDAELISVAHNFMRDLGISSTVHINSIGTKDDRERYLIELVGYLRSKKSYLCELCRRRINKNPLRCLDCKHEDCRPIIEEAPQIIDWLSDLSKNFFMAVLEYLDELEIPYVLQPTLVRGLDYYSDTVFEIYNDDLSQGPQGSQGALCGGGRYNGLIEDLGGHPTAGSGFAVGLERVVSILRRTAEDDDGLINLGTKELYFAQLGEQARKRSLKLIEDLRRSGFRVRHDLGKISLKAQLEIADKYKVSHTIILGQKEVLDGTIIIRDMDSGIQEIVDQKKIKQEVKKLIEGKV